MNKRIYSHRLWRGVAAAICVFFSVATFMAALAYERQGDINKVLKVKVPSQTVTADTNYYPASFSTRESLNEAVSAYNIQAQTEGSVLVKNADNALPLKAGERGVTLFGNAAANPVF
ncbi:MAG: hypothetical protein LBL66_08640, partial [Clostridiales bacterium]|nr:hypothetical protein [Clostridiales bacterium]